MVRSVQERNHVLTDRYHLHIRPGDTPNDLFVVTHQHPTHLNVVLTDHVIETYDLIETRDSQRAIDKPCVQGLRVGDFMTPQVVVLNVHQDFWHLTPTIWVSGVVVVEELPRQDSTGMFFVQHRKEVHPRQFTLLH